jgi:sugar lactone lactonase YvrE
MRTKLFFAATLTAVALFFAISCKKSSGGSNSSGTGTDSANSVYSSTIAANSSSGFFDAGPTGVAVDAQGNVFASVVGDAYIVKIEPSGATSVFAGTKGNFGCEAGTGTTATFTNPYTICIDGSGNIYVADYLCDGIKKITPGGVSTKFCSSDGANNVTIYPQTVCIDPQGNIYSADQLGEDGITKTTPVGTVSRFAGSTTAGYMDGAAASAEFNGLGITGLCSDAQGNIYVADPPRIRKISNGQVTTIAGNASNGFSNGKGTNATFGGAMGLCFGPDGNIYIADVYNNMIRMMTPDGTVTTVAGTGDSGFNNGDNKVAEFNQPTNLCFDSNGNLYVADYGNNVVRKITFPK